MQYRLPKSPSQLLVAVRATVCVVFICTTAPLANAACLDYAAAGIERYEQLIGADAAKASDEIKLAIEKTKSDPHADVARTATLYSLLADASSSLELDVVAHDAATTGISLLSNHGSVHDDALLRNPLYINLLYLQAANTYDQEGIKTALADVVTAQAKQVPNSAESACLLILLGHLQHQSVRDDQASISLTRAYRMSQAPERAKQRLQAAETLSYVARALGDYKQALNLNQEVIDWYTQRKAWFDVATSHFVRGEIFRLMGDHPSALREFEDSRRMSAQMKDPQGVAIATLRMCNSKIELSDLTAARALCESARDSLDKTQSACLRKESLALLAGMDLQAGKSARALTQLNEVLDNEGADVLPRRLAAIYELRARTNIALGKYREAVADLDAYLQRYKATSEAERAKDAAILRTRFETDREIERSAALQRELTLHQERLHTQSDLLKWMIIAAAIGAVLVVLLTYLHYANRKHKKQLIALAETDALTALPNRRRTFDLATLALQNAAAQDSALTIAIIDLDHFKQINDRYGHAGGDRTLRAFANASCAVLRETDTIGRWGGEEFLVVMPNTTLDTAMVILERLRAAAMTIEIGTNTRADSAAAEAELKVSISAGLATNEGGSTNLDDIVARADTALYEAKNSGRDLVRIAAESYSFASTGVRRALRGSGVLMTTGKFPRFENSTPKENPKSGRNSD